MSNPQAESHLFVQFYTETLELKAESEKQGRPIFKDVPFVRIMVPGDTNNIIERVADENDKQRFPNTWAKYQNSEAIAQDGTLLEQWPHITRALLKECKYFEIHTVEALSNISDAHVAKLGMGFGDLRTKAKAWLEAEAGTAQITAQAAENAQLKQSLADLQAQINDISETKTRRKKELIE